jgi:hypothetical protein
MVIPESNDGLVYNNNNWDNFISLYTSYCILHVIAIIVNVL